jgi:hypothetical protein
MRSLRSLNGIFERNRARKLPGIWGSPCWLKRRGREAATPSRCDRTIQGEQVQKRRGTPLHTGLAGISLLHPSNLVCSAVKTRTHCEPGNSLRDSTAATESVWWTVPIDCASRPASEPGIPRNASLCPRQSDRTSQQVPPIRSAYTGTLQKGAQVSPVKHVAAK